ncbi:MAG: hypothetical protein J6W88_01490 [Bacteroidales bacterium]|nr:hypothetical protein [Bacteroidales bacterium]
MRLKKSLFLITFSFILFTSCGNKGNFDEERTFSGNIWNRFTPESFDVNIPNTNNYYNIDVTVAIDTNIYRYDQFPLNVNLYSPQNEHRYFQSFIALKEKGRWRGEVSDGYRIVTGRVRSYFSFNHEGTHRVELGQATSQYDLEGIHSVRLTLDKTKLDLDKID